MSETGEDARVCAASILPFLRSLFIPPFFPRLCAVSFILAPLRGSFW
jgi:hypothetical protein